MTMIRADARALPLRDTCVQCVVTSPPYWGLRDYNISGQLGLEPTPDAYVANLVQVFRQVWRVLKDDGVLFVNLGDSYAATAKGSGGVGKGTLNCGPELNAWSTQKQMLAGGRRFELDAAALKPKDLVGIPWRVAFALQADGWYLRSDIIWSKPNPMPESVTDRPTKSHEYIFLLTKRERYYWDAEAVKETATCSSRPESSRTDNGTRAGDHLRERGSGGNAGGNLGWNRPEYGRNVRSVWSITTQAYAGAHFATMPEKLIERCVLAGSRSGDYVCDPFLGSGTVARVALRLGRKAVGTDLNRAYLKLADERMHVTLGLPFEWDEEPVHAHDGTRAAMTGG
jgi:DNA modification methylase